MSQAAEWVEIIEPRTKEHMFANLATGECVWDPPAGVKVIDTTSTIITINVKKTDDNQWWELFDQNTSRFYYYNATSQKTVWHRPQGCDIIPLAKLQTLKQNTEPKSSPSRSLHKDPEARRSLQDDLTQTLAASRLTKIAEKSKSGARTSVLSSTPSQTSPTSSPRPKRGRHPRCRAYSSTSSTGPGPPGAKARVDHLGPLPSSRVGGSRTKQQQQRQSNLDQSDQASISSAHSESMLRGQGVHMNGGVKRGSQALPSIDRRSLDSKHNFNNNGSIKYYSMPQKGDGSPLIKSASSASQYASSRQSSGGGNPNYGYQVPISKQRSLEGENFRLLQSPQHSSTPGREAQGQDGSLSRSISFMVRQSEQNGLMRGGEEHVEGRRSIESTPQSGRRGPQSPEQQQGYAGHQRHSRTSSVSSMGGHGAVDGFPTPMINRRTNLEPGGPVRGHQGTSESEDSTSQSPAKERRGPGNNGHSVGHPAHPGSGRPKTLSSTEGRGGEVDSGISTMPEARSHGGLGHREATSINLSKRPTYEMKERSLTSLSLQVKKPKAKIRGAKASDPQVAPVDRSPSLHKISPLQQYILEQAKLSGYRFGDKVLAEKRDSFIDSENESHRTGDDSDAFADDEAPSSDGMEERDDISLVSTVSSVGEDDNYLSEPTYNNLDPLWARRHGFGPDDPLDIDTFSEEFDIRMSKINTPRFGRGPSSTCSTIPRPTFSTSSVGNNSNPQPAQPPLQRPGSAAPHLQMIHGPPQALRTSDLVDGRRSDLVDGLRNHFDPMSQSQISESNTGSTLSVSASIHSTLSAGTLTDLENFAASNLNIQKKGLFRKKMSLKDVLSWTAESISKPLTFVNEKNLKKEAVAVFKLVQIYMSDRKAKVGMTINSVAQDIADAGYANSLLRDEIYIQLCKQCSENPRRESLRRGWELLAICLAFFPPSDNFFPYLLSFIQKHRDPTMDFPEGGRWPIHVQISHYAGISNKRLERIGIGGRLAPKKPTLEDIDQSRLQIFRPSMFGGTLQEILEIQKDRFPSRQLPWILTTLTDQIIALNGLATEGIFRIPADFDEVTSVKCRFDQWESSSPTDAHVPAALLKQWLRELYIPLIPDASSYDEAIAVGEDVELAVSLVKKLPELHRVILTYLIRFLQMFTAQDVVSVTKMDASNLSMVFAPNFMRCPSKDPLTIMENTRKEMAFVKTLIGGLDTAVMEGVL